MIGADSWKLLPSGRKIAACNGRTWASAKDSIICRAIVDKDCRIGQGVQIVNRRGAQHAEGDSYVIRDGIVVIPNGMVVPDGTVI